MPGPVNLSSQVFGQLVVLGRGERVKFGRWQQGWVVQCSCGSEPFTVPQDRLPHKPWIAAIPGRPVTACNACRGGTCVVCGEKIHLSGEGHGKRATCSPECAEKHRKAKQRASWVRRVEADPELPRRMHERRMEKAAADPEYAERVRQWDQRRQKRERDKRATDQEAAKARRRQAREWWAANRERILAKRAARRGPNRCRRCGTEFVATREMRIYCSTACRDAPPEPLAPRDCVCCGRKFVPSHPSRKTCSLECRRARNREIMAARRGEEALAGLAATSAELERRTVNSEDRRVPCRHCGIKFLPDGRKQHFCGRACQEARRAASTAPRPCVVCGAEFAGRKRSDRTCSELCRAEYKRQRARARLAGEESAGESLCWCQWCGEEFRGHKTARYCSGECLRAAKKVREASRVDRSRYSCTVCGKSMTGDLRAHRYTCSKECRQEALKRRRRRMYLRKKEREDAGEGEAID